LLRNLFSTGFVNENEDLKFRSKVQSRSDFVDRLISNAVSAERASDAVNTRYDQTDPSYKIFVDHILATISAGTTAYTKFFAPVVALVKREIPDLNLSNKVLTDLVYIFLSTFAMSVKDSSSKMEKETFYLLNVPSASSGSGWDVMLRRTLLTLHEKNSDKIKAQRPNVWSHANITIDPQGVPNKVLMRLGDIQTFLKSMLVPLGVGHSERVRDPISNLYLVVVRRFRKGNTLTPAASRPDGQVTHVGMAVTGGAVASGRAPSPTNRTPSQGATTFAAAIEAAARRQGSSPMNTPWERQ